MGGLCLAKLLHSLLLPLPGLAVLQREVLLLQPGCIFVPTCSAAN